MRDARAVIVQPVVTEKSTSMADDKGAYTFLVVRDANKHEIRAAIEKLFGVKVKDVRTMNYRGKWRRMGRTLGRRPSYKKAIVTLAEGERIDVYEGV